MQKKKLTLVAISVLLICTLLLVACGGGGDALSGTWEGKDDNGTGVTLKFDGKGGFKFKNEFFSTEDSGTYTIEGDVVEITCDGWDTVRPYTFVVSDKTLTLTRPADAYYVNFDLTKK